MRSFRTLAKSVLFTATFVAAPASAVPLFAAEVNAPTPRLIVDQIPVSLAGTRNFSLGILGPDYSGGTLAVADQGFLQVETSARAEAPAGLIGSSVGILSSAHAQFYYDNIFFSAPVNTPVNTAVTYSVNFDISGVMVTIVSGPDFSATVTAILTYGNGAFAGSFGGGEIGRAVLSSAAGSSSQSGVFAGVSDLAAIDFTATSPGSVGFAGTPIYVLLGLEIGANAIVGTNAAPGTALSSADFSSTAMFSTRGPVFNFDLPGWTANSADGCISDNRYICGPGSSTPVPEPGTLALLGLGIAGLAALRRRGK